MKNYFKKKAISNSLLKRVGFFFQEQMLDRFSFEQEEKETESMFIGSQVHKAMETDGASIGDLKVLDTNCFEDLSSSEVKILISDDPEREYFNQYNNATTRVAQEVWNSDTGDAKAFKAKQKVLDHISDIQFKGSGYLNSKLGISDENIVLNDYKLVDGESFKLLSNPQEVKNTINNCYTALSQSVEHGRIIDRDIFETCYEHFELEYYSDIDGYAVKGMFDRVIVLPEQNRAILIDYKTYGKGMSLERSIIKFGYCNQLSWYKMLFKKWLLEQYQLELNTEVYIVGVSTESYKVSVVSLSNKALNVGAYGGYLKPQIYTMYNDDEEFDPYLNGADVEWLRHNGIWSNTKNNQFKAMGWTEMFEIGIESGIFEEFKV